MTINIQCDSLDDLRKFTGDYDTSESLRRDIEDLKSLLFDSRQAHSILLKEHEDLKQKILPLNWQDILPKLLKAARYGEKIEVIKLVKQITNSSLKESKDLVETVLPFNF